MGDRPYEKHVKLSHIRHYRLGRDIIIRASQRCEMHRIYGHFPSSRVKPESFALVFVGHAKLPFAPKEIPACERQGIAAGSYLP